jgi:hypothetical protein
MSGTLLEGNCDIGADGNAGCGVTGDPSTYGVGFNAAGGGVSLYSFTTLCVFLFKCSTYLTCRYALWNSVTRESGYGTSLVPRSHPISTMDHLRILRPGEFPWPISPVQIVRLGGIPESEYRG